MIRWNLKNVTVCERRNLTMLIKSFSSFFLLVMMELLILSSALPRPRTLLSLPSLRSPSMTVKKSNSLQTYSNIQVQSSWAAMCVLNIPAALTLIPFYIFPVPSPPGPYWVLSSDYEGHSLVYGCTDFGLFRMEFSWILSREPTLNEETVEMLHGILSSIGINPDKMVSTVHDETYCRPMEQ